VAVNLLWMVPERVGGSEDYLARLLGGVADEPPADLDITLFVLSSFHHAHPRLAEAFPTEVWSGDGHLKPVRVLAENTWLPSRVRRGGFDLVHHGGGVVPTRSGAPAIVTIHDLQPLALPDNFAPIKGTYLRTMIPRSTAHARLVLTPSDQVGRDVVERLHLPPERVRTVPHGIEPIPERPTDEVAAVVDDVRHRYRLEGPYVVCPGITYGHKNVVLLVQAFARVAATHPDAALVLPGGAGPTDEAIDAEAHRLGIADQVRRLGRIPRADLDALLDGAAALAFPSRFEGFGAPVLEAMARGCPVVAADATSLPEVVGDAGVLVDPDDVAGWARAMDRLIDDPAERARLAQAGRRRAAGYTWHRGAEALLDAYRDALAPGSLGR
jgi:alpha-1,3-rhamnosyl/mannosyltransferase